MLKVQDQAENGVHSANFWQRRVPRWVKWSAGITIAVFVSLSLFLLLLPMGLNQDALRARLEGQIADWSGMALSAKGNATISFFPFKATLTDVTSKDALGAVTVTAQRLEARFSALSVITGKVDVKELWLDGARVTLRQQPGVKLGAFAESGPLKPAIEIVKAAINVDRNNPDLSQIVNRPLGAVSFSNSSLSYIWLDGREDRVMDLNATLQWLKLRGGAMARGSAFWRGENIDFNMEVASPLLLASGGSSGLDLDFNSAPLSFTFSGDANLASDFFADGNLSLKATSISRVLSWSAAPMTAAGNLGALDIAAKLTTAEGKLRFGDLQLSLDSKPAMGTLEIDLLTKPAKLAGTLAFETIDLSSLAQSLSLGQNGGADGNGENAPLSGVNLDLRLSADTAYAGLWEIKDAAGTIRIDDGNAQLDLGNGGLAGGEVSSSLRISGTGASKAAAFKFSGRNMMPDQLAGKDAAYPLIAAPVSLQIDLSGPYKTLPDFLQSGEGRLTGEAEAGTFRNFSSDNFAAAIHNGQIFALPDTYSGLASLESATVSAALKQGAAIVESSEININGMRLNLTGAIPYQTGGVALNGLIAMPEEPGNWAPFFVGGSWDKPFVTLVPLSK